MGSTLGLTATLANQPATYAIEWKISSSNGGGGNVAHSSGSSYTFTPSSAGNVTIIADLKDSTGTVVASSNTLAISITAAVSTSIALGTPANSTIYYGNSSYISSTTGTLTMSNPNNYKLEWVVYPAGAATVAQSAAAANTYVITAGNVSSTTTVTIYARLMDGTTQRAKSNEVTITVTPQTGATLSVYSPSNASTIYLSDWSGSYYGEYKDFVVTASYQANGQNVSLGTNAVSYAWYLNGTLQSNSNSRTFRLTSSTYGLKYGNQDNTLSCVATIYYNGTTYTTNTVYWTIRSGYSNTDFSVSATVYDGNNGYALSETPDEGTTSIATQIQNAVAREYGSTSYRYYTVRFDTTGYSSNDYGYLNASTSTYYDSDLSKVVFTPRKSVTSGSVSASYTFTVYLYDSYYPNNNNNYYKTLRGTLNFTIKPGTGSSGDINYSAELGSNVSFPVDDFEDFWYSMYNRGTLSYVTFGTVSGGTVYNSAGKSVGSSSYYVNPTRNQNELDGVYFAPSSTTSRTATTVRIPFTATGTTGSGSSSTTSRSGTIVITYLSAAASTINVTTSANGVATLRAQDFIDAYKAAVKTNTNPTNLTIKFQSVPSYGTLTYRDSSKSSSRDVKLTSSNIKNYSFTTKTSGSNQLGDVTYTSGSNRTETISYIGYIGNTATFSGDVTFNAVTAPTNVTVTLPTCYTTAGTALSSSVFTNANAALLSASYVTLGTPRLGTLKSSVGPTTSAIQMSSLGYVTYVPSGTNGTDSFTFAAYNSSNQVVASGTVTVVVSLPATTGSITSITQFNDIPAAGGTADWYRTQLTYLISKGMINGKGNGKFGPEEKLEYSEALKFIMNAAGIVESESKVPGTNWAQNYKNTAVQRGWMASTVDLTKSISRDAMAELTARVLGIPAGTGASPFSDSNNAWAAALYNAKIVIGSDNSAKPAFRGSDSLTRAEMVVLVYRMYQYSGK